MTGRRRRFEWLRRRRALDRDMDEEIAHHVQLRADEYVREGMDPATARSQARAKFGNTGTARRSYRRLVRSTEQATVVRSQGESRDLWGGVRQDVRYAARTLSKDLSFTAAIVLTLALGIGANVAIFTVVDAILLRSAPYDRPEPPDRLAVEVWTPDDEVPQLERERVTWQLAGAAEPCEIVLQELFRPL